MKNSQPTGIVVSEITPTSVKINWKPSIDNTEVTGYHVFYNNSLIAATTEQFIVINDLIPNSDYTFTIISLDNSLNYSEKSGTVNFITAKGIPVKKIEVKEKSIMLEIGKTYSVFPTVKPENATLKKTKLISSAPEIINVISAHGIQALKQGKATIVVQSASNEVSTTIEVNAIYPKDAFYIEKTNEPIVIDGVLEEKSWNLQLQAAKIIQGKTDNNNFFGFAYNNSHLYIAAKISDKNIVVDSELEYQDDGIEIYIDPNNSKSIDFGSSDIQFIINANRRITGQFFKEKKYNCAINKTAEGYTVEFAIPWSELKLEPQAGTLIGIDISVMDDDDRGNLEGKVTWKGNGGNWRNTSEYGTLIIK